MMICIDDVDGPFVIVLVALLAVCDLNVPTQVIVKDFERKLECLSALCDLTTTIMTETPSL